MSALRYLTGATGIEYTRLLKPINQIQKHEHSKFKWRSEGSEPAFEFSPRLRLYPGWYMVEIKLAGPSGRVNSKLYFDSGDGSSEERSINIEGRVSNTLKRLIKLDRTIRKIRFYPMETTGDFNVESLRLVPVTYQFSEKRMLKRINRKTSRVNSETLSVLKRNIEKEASDIGVKYQDVLLRYYNSTFESPGYDKWIENHERLEFGQTHVLEEKLKACEYQPTISIIVPVYNVDKKLLIEAIESVCKQVYQNWQLCIVDDASTESHVREVLQSYQSRDDRIQVFYSDTNDHISGASNKALKLVTGEYVAFLDHDDMLADHALFSMIKAINENPQADIFYSDEDKIDVDGKRSTPYFKPDWNRDLFYSCNYICHFTMIRKSVIDRIGGFRAHVNGSQDYDLLLRAVAHINFEGIVHIPQVLYHWRTIEGSTSSEAACKSYTTDAGICALTDHFASLGQASVTVEMAEEANRYRIRYPVPERQPLISLIIPTRNNLKFLKPCIESILQKTNYRNYEILIVDNQSDDSEVLQYLESVKNHDKVSVVQYDNEFNYSAINNFAVELVNGELIGLINNDVEVINGDWLTEMASHCLRDDIGCVGARLLYADKTVQHAGVVTGIGGVAGHVFLGLDEQATGYFSRASVVQNYSAVTAACLLVKKEIYQSVGGLDEENFKVAFNDVDFCLSVREAGYRNVWTPYATLFHYESKSRGYEDTPEKKTRFKAEVAAMKLKWSSKLNRDPAYNPNLSLYGEPFSIRD